MSDSGDWLNDALENASGNIPTFDEVKEQIFESTDKMSRDGYPDDFIKATLMDSVGQFRGLFFFTLWQKHVEDEKWLKEQNRA